MSQSIRMHGFDANLAPDAFRKWAAHYYQFKQDFLHSNGRAVSFRYVKPICDHEQPVPATQGNVRTIPRPGLSEAFR